MPDFCLQTSVSLHMCKWQHIWNTTGMKAVKMMMALVLCSCMMLAQKENKEAKQQLDSLRQVVLAPKMKLYGQQVEKFTTLIEGAGTKRCIKMYAKNISAICDAFEDDLEMLYDCHFYPSNNGMYVGMGYGSWLGPGFGGYMYSYPYDRYVGPGYDCLPQLFYEVDRIKRFANSMRLLSGKTNVSRKTAFIRQEMEVIHQMQNGVPGGESPAVSLHRPQ